ncbi:hypothetical protein T05_3964 [Trichinella murrelli]|uniref:Uncharacterized protein n=1 Tax=Trichinella murrelli TaxID=144512 RepID=A0A0V0T3H9_9BILA|nr:hypothetical protein T05_3964 [Trichinella murrelli]
MTRLVQYFVVLGKSIFLDFRSISNKLKKVVSIWVEMLSTTKACLWGTKMILYYKNESQISCFISFPVIPTKIATSRNFLTISHQISIYKSCDHILECSTASKRLPCAYLNTQGSSPSETPLILIDDKNFFDIIMRYSLKMTRLVQYFVVLVKSIFLDFRSISNKLKKVVSIWVEMCIKTSIC